MAKHKFKKGESGNPNGRPKTNLEKKKLEKYCKNQISEIGWQVLEMHPADMIKKLSDINIEIKSGKAIKKITNLEYSFMMTLSRSWKNPSYLNIIFDRIIGKPKQPVDHNVDIDHQVIIVSNKFAGL